MQYAIEMEKCPWIDACSCKKNP